MEKNIQQEIDKEKPVFYDPKGRRNIAFISFLCISIVSVGVVFYFFFQSIFSTPEIPNMNTAVQQDTKLVPINQKKIIRLCNEKGKPVITATHMLESMISKRRPTRAETTDVAQAIYDGTTATMLSGETASGQFPFEAASTMAKIITATEKVVNYDNDFKPTFKTGHKNLDALAYSACAAAKNLNAKAIVCFTDKGKTAKMLSKFYPNAKIIAITHDEFTYNDLALAWGVYPVKTEECDTLEEMLENAEKIVKELKVAKTGDTIVITLGVPASEKGTTNSIKISQLS